MINFSYYFNSDLTVPFQGSVRFKCTSGDTKRVREVNSTNLAIAQMNNDYNEKLLDKQLQYNQEMWEKENEYNTPAAQANRLKAAGLNPALFMNGGNSTGTAGSHLGINPIPASEAGRQQIGNPDNGANTVAAFKSLADNLQQFGVNHSTSELQSAQAQQIHIENKYKAAEEIAKINDLRASAKGKDTKAAYDALLTDLGRATFSDDVAAAKLRNQGIQAQTDLYNSNATYLGTMAQLNEKQLQYFDSNAVMDLSLKAQHIVGMKVDAALKRQMIKTEVAKAANFDADTGLKGEQKRKTKADADVVEKTTDALIRSANAAAAGQEAENRYSEQNESWWANMYRRNVNTILQPVKGVFSGGVAKTIK